MWVLKTLQTGQTLTIDLREPLWTTEDAITVIVTDYEATELDANEATYSANTWTTAAACGRGTGDPKVMTVSDDTDLTVGKYFLVAAAGNWEKVQVVSVNANRVELATPLSSAYAAGATLKPATATYEAAADVVAEEVQFTVNVQYYISGGRSVSYNLDGYVSDAPAGCPVALDDIYRIWPQLKATQQTITYGQEMQEKLDAAWDSVRSRLASKSYKAEQFKAVSALRHVTMYEFAALLAIGGEDPTGNKDPVQFGDRIDRLLQAKWNELFLTEQFVDIDETGVSSDTQNMDGRKIEW